MANKKETLTRLCKLTDRVKTEVFHETLPADCFCRNGDAFTPDHQSTDNTVLTFIELAVNSSIQSYKEFMAANRAAEEKTL